MIGRDTGTSMLALASRVSPVVHRNHAQGTASFRWRGNARVFVNC
jgi:hypothetical protein